jgi:DNA primase
MNFENALSNAGVEWHPGGKDGEISICCPFCADSGETQDTRFRLGINVFKDKAHCFNCSWGARKDAKQKVLDKLLVKAELEQEEQKVTAKPEEPIRIPKSYECLWPKKKDKDFMVAYNYVRSRGITRKQIRKHKIGFCLAGKYSYRIVFPVYFKGELVGLVTRDYTGRRKNMKYKNSKNKTTLYNFPKHKKKKRCVLVEGAIDALACERALKRYDSMAMLTKSLKDSQLELLLGYEEIVLIPDIDKPGLKGARKVLNRLRETGLNVKVAFLKGYKDCGEAPKKAIRKSVKNSVPYTTLVEYKLRTMVAFNG